MMSVRQNCRWTKQRQTFGIRLAQKPYCEGENMKRTTTKTKGQGMSKNTQFKHRIAVFASADAEIENVVAFPLHWDDILSPQSVLAVFQTDADRIFLTVDYANKARDGCYHIPVVFLHKEPQNVIGEEGFVFNPSTEKWDRFDIDDWNEENDFARA